MPSYRLIMIQKALLIMLDCWAPRANFMTAIIVLKWCYQERQRLRIALNGINTRLNPTIRLFINPLEWAAIFTRTPTPLTYSQASPKNI